MNARRYILLLLLFSAFCIGVSAQENGVLSQKLWLGLNYGQASRNTFIYESSDYSYRSQFLKLQLNYLLLMKKKFSYELHLEPGIYFSEHQLLNQWFIQPKSGGDYLEQRNRFTQERKFNEYALNIGLLIRYALHKDLSLYLLGSIGPMLSEENTERLKKGFAFSDILGLGFCFVRNKIRYDLRTTLRHNSNANISKPNNGHDSIGLEMGISFSLK